MSVDATLATSEPYSEDRTKLVQLLVRFFAGVVLVFVVRNKVEVSAKRQQAPREDGDSAPFLIFARVPELSAHVWRKSVVLMLERPFHCDAVAIMPAEISVLPIEVGAVLVGDHEPPLRADIDRDIRLKSVCRRCVGIRKVSVSEGEKQQFRLRVIFVERHGVD